VRVQPDQIVESVDASLKRLGTDYIDLLQVCMLLAGRGVFSDWVKKVVLCACVCVCVHVYVSVCVSIELVGGWGVRVCVGRGRDHASVCLALA
jgi:hypothetical protein